MKSLITALISIGLFSPLAIYAVSVTEVITNVSGGTMYVETHSSASTGGQTVSGGGSVSTGDVSASSHSETRIDAGNGGGSVNVKVEKTENGVTEARHYSKTVEPNQQLEVSVTSSNNDTPGEIKEKIVDSESVDSAAASTSSEVVSMDNVFVAASLSAETSDGVFAKIIQSVPSFLKKVFSFFGWF